jgi:hypothetical protein
VFKNKNIFFSKIYENLPFYIILLFNPLEMYFLADLNVFKTALFVKPPNRKGIVGLDCCIDQFRLQSKVKIGIWI